MNSEPSECAAGQEDSALSCAETPAAAAREGGAAADPLGLSRTHISPQESYRPFRSTVRWAEEVIREADTDWWEEQQRERDEAGKDIYFAYETKKRTTRKIQFYIDGNVIRLPCLPGWTLYENPRRRGKRGKCTGFGSQARHRLQTSIFTLDRKQLPLLVTLTYPAIWDREPKAWKRDLDVFGKWLLRSYRNASAVWKLEPQERGAPHFHLMIYGVTFVPWREIARRWWEIVGSGNEDHLRAGTSVELARSYDGVCSYLSKNYLGKLSVLPEGWNGVGRFWGVIGRKNLPRSRMIEFEISGRALTRFRRLVFKWSRSRGMLRKTGGSLTIFSCEHLQWGRAMDWVNGHTTCSMTIRDFKIVQTRSGRLRRIATPAEWQPF